jgi:hypothetical protein
MQTLQSPTEIAAPARSSRSVLSRLRDQGFGMRYSGALTLLIGIYLHVTSLLIGRELFLERVLTPQFDACFALPTTWTAIAGWLSWKRVIHRALWHRIAYAVFVVYFTLSVPIHAQTIVTGNIEHIIRMFPEGYSYLFLPVAALLLAFVWNLEFTRGGQPPAGTTA